MAGAADPWGGCWPDASTTGVPAGTVLTNYTGPCTITAANTIIDRKTVNCGLTIRASNVQITKSKINGSVTIDDEDAPYSFTITDTEVDAGPVNASANDGVTAIGKGNFVATRVHTAAGSVASGASTTAPCATPGSTAKRATPAAWPTSPASAWATAPP